MKRIKDAFLNWGPVAGIFGLAIATAVTTISAIAIRIDPQAFEKDSMQRFLQKVYMADGDCTWCPEPGCTPLQPGCES